eukprot:1542199-Pleurochrysis_carterae.AAC.1
MRLLALRNVIHKRGVGHNAAGATHTSDMNISQTAQANPMRQHHLVWWDVDEERHHAIRKPIEA